jgi:hypothetical protein
MEIFINDDEGYEQWFKAHPDGYVINAPRAAVGAVALVLHTATCGHVTGTNLHYTSTTYYKICARDKAKLEVWAKTQPRALRACRTCAP